MLFSALFSAVATSLFICFRYFQEPDGGRVDDSQNQIQFIVDDYVLPAGVLDEVRYQLRVVIADRNDDSVIGDNADGHSDERHAALVCSASGCGGWSAASCLLFPYVGARPRRLCLPGMIRELSALRLEFEIIVVRAFYVDPAVGLPFGLSVKPFSL